MRRKRCGSDGCGIVDHPSVVQLGQNKCGHKLYPIHIGAQLLASHLQSNFIYFVICNFLFTFFSDSSFSWTWYTFQWTATIFSIFISSSLSTCLIALFNYFWFDLIKSNFFFFEGTQSMELFFIWSRICPTYLFIYLKYILIKRRFSWRDKH